MKKWLKSIFYNPKDTKPTDENIMRLLMPSFVGIVICMVCLAGSTWAWFTATVYTPPQTISTANFDVEVTVDGTQVTAPIKLNEGQAYDITINAIGNAPSGGYCKIEIGDKAYYTDQVLPGKPLTFKFAPETTDNCTFTGVWGKYSGEGNIIRQGDIIGQAQPDKNTNMPTEQPDNTGDPIEQKAPESLTEDLADGEQSSVTEEPEQTDIQ